MTSYKARLMNKDQAYESLVNGYEYPLINVTAITSAGSPITTQMWNANLSQVRRSVSRWQQDCAQDNHDIIRVFTHIRDTERGSATIEWKWWSGVESLEYLDTLEVHAPPLLDEANTSRAAD